jgi:hypothetical protein
MDFDRDPVTIDLSERARILFRSGGRPIDHYAVMLQVEIDGEWHTVRLIDNHLDQHHMHRYDGHQKGGPEHFAHGTVNEVIPQAIRYMRDHFQPIIDSWTTA